MIEICIKCNIYDNLRHTNATQYEIAKYNSNTPQNIYDIFIKLIDYDFALWTLATRNSVSFLLLSY